MGIFTRISELVSANLHALLDSVEDPEKMLAQVVREMEDGLAAARRQAARAIAAERRLERELNQQRVAAEHWTDQAGKALQNGREDLARQALARKLEHVALAAEIEGQHHAAKATSREVRSALQVLEGRLGRVRRKLRLLLAQHSAAKVRREVSRLAAAALDGSFLLARFEHFENRLLDSRDQFLAEAEIIPTTIQLDTDLAAEELCRRVEDELSALKKQTRLS
jgi:phage shock protein A